MKHPYISRQSVVRANTQLMLEGRNPGSTCSCAREQARELLRRHGTVSVAEAGRLAMQSLYGDKR